MASLRSNVLEPIDGIDTSNVILILNYNGGRDTLECLESLRRDSVELARGVIVIDNKSTDDSLEVISRHFPEVTIVEHPRNLGFAEGYNEVINRVMQKKVESILLLNNDTILRIGTYHRLMMSMREDESIGAIGPAILDMGSNNIQSLGATILWKQGRRVLRHRGQDYDEITLAPTEVDYVSGSAMLLRCKAITKAGLLPPHFFMYDEDSDLCVRIRRCGFKVVCDPRAVVEHKEASTVSRYPGLKERYMTRNRILLMKRHGLTSDFILFMLWLIIVEIPITSLRSVLKKQRNNCVMPTIVGVVEGIVRAMNERRIMHEEP